MYRVGFVDNDFELFPLYQKKMERQGVNLLSPETSLTKKEIAQWILDQSIRCLLVDFKLKPEYSFTGTELVAYINSLLPDLPCIILTAYPEDSISEYLVIKAMIHDRDVFSQEGNSFAEELKNAVQVYNNRLTLHMEEYVCLLAKRRDGKINAVEEERFLDIYKLLKAYGEIDELPTELLRSDIG